MIVESIAADRNGMLYLPDRVTGNILRVDPKSPKPTVVGRIEAREIKGKKVNRRCLPALLSIPKVICLSPSVRSPKLCASGQASSTRPSPDWLRPSPPEHREPMASSSTAKEIFLSQAAAAGSSTASAQTAAPPKPAAQIDKNSRTLPDGKTQQAITANGVEFDRNGVLHVSDTSRGAIWKVAIGPDGKGGKPTIAGAESVARRRRRSGLRSAGQSVGDGQ